ncbi:MAG: putative bifunctional diguanylate cyclase/phosphodiesterase [Angustibacter sp.]
MQVSPPGKSALSWSFDFFLMVSGIGLGVLVLGYAALNIQPRTDWAITLAVGAPLTLLIMLIARFPLHISGRGATGIEVSFESAVLVMLSLQIGSLESLVIWIVAQWGTAMIARNRPAIRVFNAALFTICGTLTVAIIHHSGQVGTTSPAELGAVAFGCLVYFVIDYCVSALSVSLEDHNQLLRELKEPNGLLSALAFVAVNSLGYLSAVVLRELPSWSGFLLLGPLATILVASRALSRGGEHQRRLGAMFHAAAAMHTVRTVPELVGLLHRHASVVTARPPMRWQQEPPGTKELGLQVPPDLTGPDEQPWLVTRGDGRARSSLQQDRAALQTLGGVAEQALLRLKLVDQLAEQARVDQLTGLANRLAFTERLEAALTHRDASSQGTGLAVIYVDLDGFKSVNDRFGHAAGDELLRRVGSWLTALVPPPGVVARLGGDEFAILLIQVPDSGQVERTCRHLLSAVRVPVPISGHTVQIGASIGVAVPEADEDREPEAAELMRNADMAMYRAKSRGKNEYVIYRRSLRDERIRRLELVEALRSEIEDGLVVHYQPVVDLRNECIVGAEALARWRHDGTLVAPDVFIPIAEESGLIVPLGRRVLRQVVEDAPRLVQAAGRPLDVAVNVSAHQLRDEGLVERVRQAVATLSPSRLVLEMTESVLVEDDEPAARTLRQMTAAGARLAIDDFGVGYSSIGYLQHLPVDVVKIDRSFIRGIDTHERARALVDAVLVMASALDLEVVAEGIERPEQTRLLRASGCTLGQGYQFARPRPLPEFLELLRGPVAVGPPTLRTR